jgi:hypothetical protein
MTGDVKTIRTGPRVVGKAGWMVVDKLTAQAIDDEDKGEAKKIEGKAVHVAADGTVFKMQRKALESLREAARSHRLKSPKTLARSIHRSQSASA